MTDPIVITGAGVCCNMGDDLEQIEADLRAGRNRPFDFWAEVAELGAACKIIGKYPDSLDDDAIGATRARGRFLGRAARLALKASRTALTQSGADPRPMAVVFGSGTGDVATHLEVAEKLAKSGARRVPTTVIPKLMSSTVSANLVNVLGSTGPSFSASAACAGGAYNILLAAELVRSGHADAALAGGSEAADVHFHVGFDSMRAYNREDDHTSLRASRPYAADRAGFIFGEGAGAVVLERRSRAEGRGAPILGVLHGWGMSSNGDGEMVAPASGGALEAMRKSLRHASIDPERVGYVNTHGTSTPLGDAVEVRAIREVLGGRHVPYGSTKSFTGHTISAAGAIEAIFTLAMLRGGWLAPSINADPLDPELADYPPILAPTDRDVEIALSNSFGFGGTNVTLVLGRP
jgi:3-oxoacyl-[acyl-carrier-protein] synthase-1